MNQTLEDVIDLYDDFLLESERLILNELFNSPRFQALPKRWVPEDSGQLYTYNLEVPVRDEDLYYHFAGLIRRDPLKSTTFLVDTLSSLVECIRDPKEFIIHSLATCIEKYTCDVHLVMSLHATTGEDRSLFLYYDVRPVGL
jgi:hypothetical protein